MDLTTSYLGMTLKTPIVPSAGPLCEDIDNLRKLEDAGAAAVVLPSLFEEQLALERLELFHHLSNSADSHAEATSYFPESSEYRLGPEDYLEHIQNAKAALDIPVIASLNGSSVIGWAEFAKKMADAGADAVELNLYHIPTDADLTAAQVEDSYTDILKAVKGAIDVPVALKLSPYFSNMGNMAQKLDDAGADALVLFNRFYQPDIDLETLEVHPNVILSTPQALRLPLRWVAILKGRIRADLAATSGIHTAEDVIKLVMAGANITMMCSALLKNGIDHLRTVEQGVRAWMEEYEYDSIRQMRGSMCQRNVEDPSAFERAQYMRALTSYRPK